jgi:hypothetical protein
MQTPGMTMTMTMTMTMAMAMAMAMFSGHSLANAAQRGQKQGNADKPHPAAGNEVGSLVSQSLPNGQAIQKNQRIVDIFEKAWSEVQNLKDWNMDWSVV